MAHIEREDTRFDYQGLQAALLLFEELTHFCLTPDHDVLTRRGWIPIAGLLPGDAVLARIGNKAQFRTVRSLEAFDYEGEIVDIFQRRGISGRMTPNHRVLVQRQDERKSLGFVRADHLQKTIQMVPRLAVLERPDNHTPIAFAPLRRSQGMGSNQNSVISCGRDAWLRFLGWYLSEGSTSNMRASPIVRIAQTKPAPGLDDVMRNLPWRASPEKRGGWRVCSRQLAEVLMPLGDTYTKRVPRWIMGCSPRQIRLFLDAFISGDGHRDDSGGVQIGLANRGLRDDIHELCVLAGFVATASDGLDSTKKFASYRLCISRDGRSTTMVRPRSVTRFPYKGKVYCPIVDCPDLPDFTRGGYGRPRVPGGNFLVRHRGRVHFTGNTAEQFWYLQSRNRSGCGVRPWTMGTCNPDPDSWVAALISWWIDQETGYPIPERGGVLRYFTRLSNEMFWGDTRDEVRAALPPGTTIRDVDIQSLTFIPGKLEENVILERADPAYRGKLMAMTRVNRARLLDGNWKIRADAGSYFRRSDCRIIDAVPNDVVMWTRRWDLAATEPCEASPDPDFTWGLKLGRYKSGRFVVAHCEIARKRANDVRALVRRSAENDGVGCSVGVPQDPAQAGKDQAESYILELAGFDVYADHETGDKETRAEPVAAQWQHGNIDVVRGPWNDAFFGQLESFPAKGTHDDAVDALSGAFKHCLEDDDPFRYYGGAG
jgi:predicted phage terminase large subunit-like protein